MIDVKKVIQQHKKSLNNVSIMSFYKASNVVLHITKITSWIMYNLSHCCHNYQRITMYCSFLKLK